MSPLLVELSVDQLIVVTIYLAQLSSTGRYCKLCQLIILHQDVGQIIVLGEV